MNRGWAWAIGILAAVAILFGAYFFLFQKPAVTPVPNNPQNPFGTTGPGTPAPIPSKPVSATPQGVTLGFYKWYLNGIINTPKFLASQEFLNQRAYWLTGHFITNWQSLIESTGADPVLLAQDYQDTWLTDVSATLKNQSATSSDVLVAFSGGSVPDVLAHLVRTGNSWLIDSVSHP